MEVKRLMLSKDLKLDDDIIKAGECVLVSVSPLNSEKPWTVFHKTGWWAVESKYFEHDDAL